MLSIRKTAADNWDKPTRYYSKKQEEGVANLVGGRRVKNSGATMFDKSDVSSDKFLIECKTKTTQSKSMSIHKEWLEKLRDESLFMGKPYQALFFNFGPDTKNYVIIDENLFKNMMDAFLEVDDE